MMLNDSVCENILTKINEKKKKLKKIEKHIKWKSLKHTKTTVPYMLKMSSPSQTV